MPRLISILSSLSLLACLSAGGSVKAQDRTQLMNGSTTLLTDVPPFVSVDADEKRDDIKSFTTYFTFVGNMNDVSLKVEEANGESLQVESESIERIDALTCRFKATITGWKPQANSTACAKFMIKQPNGTNRWVKSMILLAPHYTLSGEFAPIDIGEGKPDFDKVFNVGGNYIMHLTLKTKMGADMSGTWIFESSSNDVEMTPGNMSYAIAMYGDPYSFSGTNFTLRALTPGIKHLKIRNEYGHPFYKSIYVK